MIFNKYGAAVKTWQKIIRLRVWFPLQLSICNLQEIVVNLQENAYLNFETKRRNEISLNQLRGISAKMAANGIRTHTRTN